MSGMVGRPPKPTRLKLLEGNRGKRPLTPDAVTPAALPLADPPEVLAGVARDAWFHYGQTLADAGLISELDTADFTAFCMNIQIRDEAWEKLEETGAGVALGLIVKTPNGYPIQSPYLAIFTRACAEIRCYTTVFGMNPSARVRITGEAQMSLPFQDPFEKYLAESA